MSTGIELRPFGRTGESVSCIGLGGFHLGVPKDPEIAVEMVRSAVEAGITFMDNSWDYHGGESEMRMGRALEGGLRDRVFLMTKLDSRTREGTMRQLEESLTRLRTDHLDLLQLHEVIRHEDYTDALAEDGPFAAYRELKEQGVIRFFGFTGHKDPTYHRRLIEEAVKHGLVPDSVQMPINPFDASFRSFRQEVLPLCQEHGIAVIGMKPLGAGKLVGRAGLEAADLLRWSLSQPVSVVVTGCESAEDVAQAVSVASGFVAVPQRDLDVIAEKVAPLAREGVYEEYKVSDKHDSTAKNRHWMD